MGNIRVWRLSPIAKTGTISRRLLQDEYEPSLVSTERHAKNGIPPFHAATAETTGTRSCGRIRSGVREPRGSCGCEGACEGRAYGKIGIFDLKVEGGQTIPALIKEVQQQQGKILHVDFQQVSKNKPIRVKIPLHYTGTAAGTQVGGVLQIQATELEVEGLPDVLPASLDIDITSLDAGDKLMAGDVKMPAGVTMHAQPEELLASIVLPRVADTDLALDAAADGEPAGTVGSDEAAAE